MDPMSTVQQVLVTITVILLATVFWIYRSRRQKEKNVDVSTSSLKGATVLKGKRCSGTSILPDAISNTPTSSVSSLSSLSSLNGNDDKGSISNEEKCMNFHSFTKDRFTEEDMNSWPLGCPMAAMFGELKDDHEGEERTRDPKQYCDHIQSEVKKAEQNVANRQTKDKLTPEQIEEEKNIQRQQVEAIYKLMSEDGERFGISSVNDMHNQMKLYM